MTSIFGFSESFANDIKDVVEIVKSSGDQMDFGHGLTPAEDEFYYVKLEEDLDSPADLTEPTTAKALVMMPTKVVAGNPKSGLGSTGQSIDIVNRFVSFTAGVDEVILVKWKWGEFIPLNAGGGSPTPMIQFRISSSDFCDSCTVKARVLAIPPGTTIGSLPDIDTYDNDSVTIYDKSGCFFNEPEEDLLNRIGFAHRLNFLEDGPCANTVGELWAVTSLCCDDLDCTDINP
jgi:hypothetical protein